MVRSRPIVAAALALGLAACGGGGEELKGRGYLPASDVTVSRTIPLTVPPDFGLRPEPDTAPTEGATVIEQQQTTEIDTAMLTATMGEQALMMRAGTMQANPNIRQVLNRENALLADDPALVDALLFGSYGQAGQGAGTDGDAPAVVGVVIEEGAEVAPDVAIEQGEAVEEGTWFDDVVDIF